MLRLRREPLNEPAAALRAPVPQPIVEAVLTVLPELKAVGHQPETSPEVRHRQLGSLVPLRELSNAPLELLPRLDRLALGEASALSWLPRGRVRTYAADSSTGSRSTGPSIRTWRPSGSQ